MSNTQHAQGTVWHGTVWQKVRQAAQWAQREAQLALKYVLIWHKENIVQATLTADLPYCIRFIKTARWQDSKVAR